MFQFDNTYARLPERFYAAVYPEPVEDPVLLKFNEALARELGIDADLGDPKRLAAILAGNVVPQGAAPIAMAYAGHQFGSFVPQLGDGRAILIGEVLDQDSVRRDIQLKGSGPTPFSRRGDGRAALGPVLREYIISEAMNALAIPATRALAAIATGEPVYRETALPGAIFVRVASSHVRIGTFQYFAARGDLDGLRTLADYVIERHYPHLKGDKNPYRELLATVTVKQASLVARWMGVGFVHGVMNTDNMTLSGETIDFGPCAFLDEYDPMKVFSSIDAGGRYAYRNQPGIAQWNIARLAECLLPLIDEDKDKAVVAANEVVTQFGRHFEGEWLSVFCRKLGFEMPRAGDTDLIQALLALMQEAGADFTLTFRRLCGAMMPKGEEIFLSSFGSECEINDKASKWLERWHQRLESEAPEKAEYRMRSVNPAIIPRNHQVEAAIAVANDGDLGKFELLLQAVANPYEDRPEFDAYTIPPEPDERVLRTFCGT